MIPTGLKLYAGIAFAALAAAAIGGYTSGGTVVGPLSAGYKGGIGDWVSYVVLVGVAFVSVIVGGLLTVFRDADAQAVAASMGRAEAPVGQRPVAGSVWPIVAGIGAAFLLVGMAVNAAITGVGLVIVAIVAFEWTMTAWADRATGDTATNENLRNQLMGPFEVPLLGLMLAAVVAIAVSRIFLAVSALGAVIVGGVVAVIILGVGVFAAMGPKVSKNLLTGLASLVMLGILVGGVWGAVQGTRVIEEHHGEEEGHSEEEDHSEEGGSEAVVEEDES